MVRRLLCFGDSNTYGWQGTLSGPALRYPRSVRWTGRLGALLGPDWDCNIHVRIVKFKVV